MSAVAPHSACGRLPQHVSWEWGVHHSIYPDRRSTDTVSACLRSAQHSKQPPFVDIFLPSQNLTRLKKIPFWRSRAFRTESYTKQWQPEWIPGRRAALLCLLQTTDPNLLEATPWSLSGERGTQIHNPALRHSKDGQRGEREGLAWLASFFLFWFQSKKQCLTSWEVNSGELESAVGRGVRSQGEQGRGCSLFSP